MINDEWEYFTKTVSPLKKKGQSFRKNTFLKEKTPKEKLNDPCCHDDEISLTNSSANLEKGIDKNLIRRIKKGKILINESIDLHGIKFKEAKNKIFYFIKDNYKKNNRLLIIITGKGERSKVNEGWKGKGVLNKTLPDWLTSDQLSRFILWFDNAPIHKGGSGAYLVYLKKFKE